MNPAEIMEAAAAFKLHTIGFANHMWDSTIPGVDDWYKPQDVSHVLAIRSQIPARTNGLRVMVGCETEYLGGGVLGISRDAIPLFDYILIPATHFHMKGFVAPDMTDCRDIASLMKRRFDEIVGLNVQNSGIAHPFLPFGYFDKIEEIMSHLSDTDLYESFRRAAGANISMEISTKCFPTLYDNPPYTWPDDIYIRVLSIAKSAGCKFHLASDAHNLDQIGLVTRLAPIRSIASMDSDDYSFGCR
jgi:histidinol phosphatase-like PHP family hydrolase